MNDNLPNKPLTVQEVAEFVRVAPVTIRRWIKKGKLDAVKMGRRWLIDPLSLPTFIREGDLEEVRKDD